MTTQPQVREKAALQPRQQLPPRFWPRHDNHVTIKDSQDIQGFHGYKLESGLQRLYQFQSIYS